MRARDLAVPAPLIEPSQRLSDALRLLVSAGLPGLVVDLGHEYVVVPASQVLRVAVPTYVRDDPSLARVWDEASSDDLASTLAHLTVADLVDALERPSRTRTTAVDGDATLLEIAAVLSAAHVPLVAVVDNGRFLGVVSVNVIVDRLVG
ncbi:MAG: CBS domain-containing protein [Candidatus Nanopelagicales bacterium]